MKRSLLSCMLFGLLLFGLSIAAPQCVSAGTGVSDGKVKVFNPRGKPPDIPLATMAERPAGLVGKTVYFVDVRFMNGDIFLKELQKVFQEKYPGIKTEFRQKFGGYNEDDPKLWAEIKENNGVMVMAIGH